MAVNDSVAGNDLGDQQLGDRHEGHPLPCGRLVEDVFDDLDHGRPGSRSDEHGATCTHCATARRSLMTLMEATRALIDDPAEPPANLLDRIMQAVRAEARRGDAIPLLPADDTGTPARTGLGPVDISEQAVAAVVRYAADTVDGVRARSCRVGVDPVDPQAMRVEMTVSLRYGAGPVSELLDVVRARIDAALQGQVGVRAGTVDVQIVDLWPGEEQR